MTAGSPGKRLTRLSPALQPGMHPDSCPARIPALRRSEPQIPALEQGGIRSRMPGSEGKNVRLRGFFRRTDELSGNKRIAQLAGLH